MDEDVRHVDDILEMLTDRQLRTLAYRTLEQLLMGGIAMDYIIEVELHDELPPFSTSPAFILGAAIKRLAALTGGMIEQQEGS